ncbi:pimeloyl-ACP methyl ester carboxylesterase [Bradyrhizobium macuxiense]|uniref:Pimeloyl-ACP methyl ester carboxylesterase n=1 Tax=Bradyrhizobium macuxiense TaxID=1755647 RepID=A0A560KX89_9BRAD|nr:alpha/beta fold hydrolase [Bradyrhizobium macuxiense]TWB87757.1 pimeloyl-ACP methyl ester carboxylesterase [Bradyrhizobium macuxiense]
MSKHKIIFVPGLASDGRLWQPVIDPLSDIVESTIARCSGKSITDFADEILADAPDGFVIAGISMGGYVALEVALRGDTRLAGVALLNTNARPASTLQLQRSTALLEDARRGLFDAVAGKLAETVAGGKVEVAAFAAAMARRLGCDGYLRQQQAVLNRPDQRSLLPQIAVPTLVIAGDDDRICPPSLANEIARSVPGAELEIFPCGHLSTVEVPEMVSASLRDWLSRRIEARA